MTPFLVGLGSALKLSGPNIMFDTTRQSKHCRFCISFFGNSFPQSKLMVRLVRAEKIVLSGLVTLLITIEHIKRLKNIIGLG